MKYSVFNGRIIHNELINCIFLKNMNINGNLIFIVIQSKIHNSHFTSMYSTQNIFLLNAVSKMINKSIMEMISNYQRKKLNG